MTIQQLLKTAPVTTLLLISFIGLFIMQVLSGVDANNPSTEALLKWGANALPYTMDNEPWRLASSAFLHIGLMHLLFNGFAMYFFGQIAEPMFGSAKFLALFLLAAIGGNLLNNYITWQGILDGTGQPGLSAGASGGIMGIGAALLIAALFKISVNGMVLNLKSLIIIMGINLVYGFAVPGIDNAGHIGGAVTGLVIALAFAIAYRQRLAATLQNVPSAAQDIYQTTYINSPTSSDTDFSIPTSTHAPRFDNGGSFDNNSSFNHDSAVNLPLDSYANQAALNHSKINEQQTVTKSTFIWQLLPWLVMLLISIGFIWWWQDIHQQILQVLAAIE
ncbi:rhomboid family intramembrane serine protease [Psychrobacter sp. M9-54-1]|uniref:rhomboid family intramembrane serine protease n=1 Tax=unclassified Psychrobacter TaxID=196806 RepID=UPI0007F52AEA|nr:MULTISPECIES: rhomboid family intramembrane serine protease [unclassified Psychrobacter]MBK3394920.1 rhomboid family intramembrane serine protease [Psychrobacter sp. M9-54-1]OAP69314.1 rhomboid family intramembrane serine protease [Psychrobacter sp. SHUES1]